MENEKLFNETIILIGPSGAGKSTVGQILSERTKLEEYLLIGLQTRREEPVL